MKKYPLYLVFLFSFCLLKAQNKRTESSCCNENIFLKPGFNGLASLVLTEIGKKSNHSFLESYYGINPIDGNANLTGILKTYGPLSDSCVSLFHYLNKVSEGLFTFSIPLKNFSKLQSQEGIHYVSISRVAEPQMGPRARKDAGFDKVHQGLNLPQPYTGKGVVCGIVDIGIDWSHPSFRNETGDSLRILRTWAQNQKTKSPPSGFTYGAEYIGKKAILDVQFDSIPGIHGTITTGSMAGGGFGSQGVYTGAAPGCNLIPISSNYSENSLLDAINYFFTQVKVLNKRGVFNLSWGSHIGPHDGTSLFDQAIDSVVAKGGLMTGAAGNWGQVPLHLENKSGSNSVTTSSVISDYDTAKYSIIDIWGKPNSSFQVQVKSIDKTTGVIGTSTAKLSTLKDGQSTYNLIFGKDTTLVYLIMTTSDLNNKRPNCLVAFSHNHVKTNKNLGVSISSVNNEVHAWAGSNALFSSKTLADYEVPGYINGDIRYTVGELGGTSKSIITVGAHVTQHSFRTVQGTDYVFAVDSGKIEEFSSYGPTLDGRIKPDLTAPGSVLTPVNSFEFDLNVKSSVIEGSEFSFEGKKYYYLGEQATSYAAPVVAGSIALLLEAKPDLTFQQMKDALLKNTTTDSFTGDISLTGSPNWGYGKLNIHKAITSLLGQVTANDIGAISNSRFWYSNPVQSSLAIFAPDFDSKISILVYDLYGRVIQNGLELISNDGAFYYFNSSPLQSGQYIAILKSGNGISKSIKLTKF